MDLKFSPSDDAFRAEVRAFVADNLPAGIREKVQLGYEIEKHDYATWHRILFERGWAAPNWPVSQGGTGWSATQRHIFEEELAYAWAPRLLNFALGRAGPLLMQFGSEQQQQQHLPRILSGEELWCQGYSEPGAGSDLAALATRAEARDGHYIVNGTKIWTSYARWADWIFMLVRTSAHENRHDGISVLIVDMKSPGISVRPIDTIGHDCQLNEVHFSNVEVPLENRIGEEGKGWKYAMFLLQHERTSIGGGVATARKNLRQLRELVTASQVDDERLDDRISEVEIALEALALTELRVLAALTAGNAPGPESSVLKIKRTELQQTIGEIALDVVGPYIDTDVESRYFDLRKTSIYGGSNEVQKNIIAKRILHL
jgi:alkylation response protein AidB-like acyl-CoA dehydrogenase